MIGSSSRVTGDARLPWKKDFPTRDCPLGFRSAEGGNVARASRDGPFFYEEKGGAVEIMTKVQLTGLNGLVTFRA